MHGNKYRLWFRTIWHRENDIGCRVVKHSLTVGFDSEGLITLIEQFFGMVGIDLKWVYFDIVIIHNRGTVGIYQ